MSNREIGSIDGEDAVASDSCPQFPGVSFTTIPGIWPHLASLSSYVFRKGPANPRCSLFLQVYMQTCILNLHKHLQICHVELQRLQINADILIHI